MSHYESDVARPSSFDGGRIRQLREDAALHHVDYSRGQIVATESGAFWVKLSAPLVDVSVFLPAVPTSIEAKHSAAAEGELLTWLVRIQVAERRVVRMGTCGRSPEQVNRQPLTQDEIDRYLSRRKEANQITKLRIELGDAIAAKERAKAAQADAETLNKRYGITPAVACAVPTDGMNPALNAPSARRK